MTPVQVMQLGPYLEAETCCVSAPVHRLAAVLHCRHQLQGPGTGRCSSMWYLHEQRANAANEEIVVSADSSPSDQALCAFRVWPRGLVAKRGRK